jgi:three-Cys-motif partner protein
MPKKETAQSVLPHTEAKLQLYINYLERYLAILLRAKGVSQVNIYDMFCGEGLYGDGKSGSALRAVEVIWAAVQSSTKKVTVNLLLNDLDEKKVAKVESMLSNRQSVNSGIGIRSSSREASDLIDQLAVGFRSQADATRNLVFIDPYGYKPISYPALKALLENNKTEIILFLPIEQMYRFLCKVEAEVVDKSYIPLKRFIDQFGLDVNEISSEKGMIRAINNSLTFDGNYRSTCYSIKNHSGHYYGMFFVTRNLYGLEKILEVKWKLDEQQGEGFSGIAQNDMFFEFEKMEWLREKLFSLLESSEINNFDLYELTIESGYLPKHMNTILKKMQKDGVIAVTDKFNGRSARKGAFKINYQNWRDKESEYTIALQPGGGS